MADETPESHSANIQRRTFLKDAGLVLAGALAGAGGCRVATKLSEPKSVVLKGREYLVMPEDEYNYFIARAEATMAQKSAITSQREVGDLFRVDELIIPEHIVGTITDKVLDRAILGRNGRFSNEDALSALAHGAQENRSSLARQHRWNNLLEGAASIFLQTQEGKEYRELLKNNPKAAAQQLLSKIDFITSQQADNAAKLKLAAQEILSQAADNVTIKELSGINSMDSLFDELTGRDGAKHMPSSDNGIFDSLQHSLLFKGFIDEKGNRLEAAKTEAMQYLWDEAVKPGTHKFSRDFKMGFAMSLEAGSIGR